MHDAKTSNTGKENSTQEDTTTVQFVQPLSNTVGLTREGINNNTQLHLELLSANTPRQNHVLEKQYTNKQSLFVLLVKTHKTVGFIFVMKLLMATAAVWTLLGQVVSGQETIVLPSDPTYYDGLRDRNADLLQKVDVSTDSNVFLVQLDDETETQYRLAELKAFLPLSNGESVRQGYQDDAAAALLAVYHFNNLEMSPVLSEEDLQDCNVKLTMDIIDSKFSPIGSTRVFTESLHTENTLSTPLPTAVIGAYRSATTSPLAILTGVNGIPQASYASSSTDFDVKEQFPLFGRTVTSSTGEAKVALDYFQSIGATHVGVLFVTVSAIKLLAREATTLITCGEETHVPYASNILMLLYYL